jgi:hypothetical protein
VRLLLDHQPPEISFVRMRTDPGELSTIICDNKTKVGPDGGRLSDNLIYLRDVHNVMSCALAGWLTDEADPSAEWQVLVEVSDKGHHRI